MVALSDGVDEKKLQKLYGDDPDARAVLDHFAQRERNQNVSTVNRLMVNISNLSRGQVVRVLKELDRLGCGEFKAGRKGHESRFEWHVSSKSVGQVAAGEGTEIEQEVPNSMEDSDLMSDELIEHRYQLRPNLPISIALPADFSPLESKRLATFVRTLPFAAGGTPANLSNSILPAEDFSDWEK